MFLSAAMGKGSGKGGSWTRADWDQFNARKYGTKIKQEEDSEQPDDDDAADASQLPEPRYQKRRKGNDFSQYKRQIQHEHGKVLQKQFDMEKQNMDLQFKLKEQDLVSQISIVENERDKFQRVAQALEQQAATFKESAEKLAAAESAVKLLQASDEEWKDRCEDYRTRLDLSLNTSKYFRDRLQQVQLDNETATAKIKSLEAELNSKNEELSNLQDSSNAKSREFDDLQESYNAKKQEFDQLQDSYTETLLDLQWLQARKLYHELLKQKKHRKSAKCFLGS